MLYIIVIIAILVIIAITQFVRAEHNAEEFSDLLDQNYELEHQLHAQIRSLKSDADGLASDIDKVAGERDKANKEASFLQERLQQLATKFAELAKELKRTVSERDNLFILACRIKGELLRTDKELRREKLSASAYRLALMAAEEKIKELADANSKLAARNEQLEGEVEDLTKAIKAERKLTAYLDKDIYFNC